VRQAIETRYLGPTNTYGARIKAKCDGGSVIVYWDHALDADDNHLAAARKLQDKMGWAEYPLSGGSLPRPHPGYAFVLGLR